ncbi:uncharacterized protein LOC125530702 [Triticum urartu]|uniref:NB-ARC domain-containing protein n=1 Tax=Triticum urartu TaxID=4572 RepID=A0A8R7VJ44_TRIUA|nr:uncharacterized protein LOC125530702 [Triticum urartu]XP_048551055.1 uncharacterized protein LOC125530702 [Triticum urartu]XP_048551056.1 uncharacterized protein LOC125530702 [Triticum urartu]
MDVGWRKKSVEASMDLGSTKNWGAYTGIFIVLMLIIAAIPHDEDYHDFADQRTLLLGIPNTLNVVSIIPFIFVGLAGLILKHCESYCRPCSQRGLYTLFFAGVSVVGFASFFYHLNPKNDALFWDTLPIMIAFTSFEVIFIIERFDDSAGTKSFESTSYWLWAVGFYVLARVEEVADKPIYTWTLHIVSGHTLGHLCAAMVPLFFILMLAKRTRPIQPERHMILVHHQLMLAFMVCLLVPKMICLWMPKLQVRAIMYEISILMWEFSARYVGNQAKTSEERGMLETPVRARQIVPRIRGLYGMDTYKNKVLEFIQSERSDESIFGLWGTSGVGKTRLLSLIADSYADSFRHVIFLDGGSSVRVMQNYVAYFLKLDWETISLLEEHYRAKIIMEYLEHVSFLVLLDDVQDEVYPDLTAVGLPMALGHRQKVVLTSRSQVVCARMGCTLTNTLEMKCLGDEDAWSLFEYNAGVKITEADTEIYEYAKQMVSACGGLPRAICAIGIGVAGATCRGKHPVDWWFTYKRFKDKNLPPERMEEIVPVLV